MTTTSAQSEIRVPAQAQVSPRSEWRAHWLMVISAMAGLSFATISVYSIGLFMDPLHTEFGWTHSQVSLGISIMALFVIPLSPAVGALIDRWGSRYLAIPGVILSALAFASLGFANGSASQWLLLWILYAFFAVFVKATVWTAAVSSLFVTSRGLALAVTLSGATLCASAAPLLAQWLVDDYGWRNAFVWLGLGWGGLVLALVVPFFFDAHDHKRRGGRLHHIATDQPIRSGLTLRQALRTPSILRIATALFIATTLGVAITVNKVPLLTAGGMSRHDAALVTAFAGTFGIAGKLLTGWLLDRWQSGWIGGISLSLPAIAYLALLDPSRTLFSTIVAIMIFAYSSGAYLQVCTYLTSRYGGLMHFGKIFGLMASLMSLGSSVGTQLASLIFDRFGSYTPLLIGAIPLVIIAGLLVSGLGPYPNWDKAQSTTS